MRLDGVFLDMYGTLTTGDRAAVEAVCSRVIADTGVAVSPGELAITWGERFFAAMEETNGHAFETLLQLEARTLHQTMAELGRTIDPWAYVSDLTRYWRDPPLQPEVPEFLRLFRLPICIVSNADRADVEIALARHRITVAGLVTSEDVRAYKPDPRVFQAALEVTGWRPQRVLHVGDSLHSDVGGARRSGLRVGWVNRAQRIHDIGTGRPDYEFADLMDLYRLLAGAHDR